MGIRLTLLRGKKHFMLIYCCRKHFSDYCFALFCFKNKHPTGAIFQQTNFLQNNTCCSLMYQWRIGAGWLFPDVQFKLISSPIWYCNSTPAITGSSFGKTRTKEDLRNSFLVQGKF